MLENFSTQELKKKFESNKNTRLVTYIVGGILILVIGYFGYRQFIWKPANEKSKDAYWPGLNLAAQDSTDKAIDELKPVVKQYDGKIGGENAQFVLARQYMNKGQYKKALEELEGVEVSDTYVSAMVLGLQGDCHSEMKDFEKAGVMYLEAAGVNENELTTPMYLFKAGLCAEKVKDFEKALECYTKIKDDYPSYGSQKSIEKYVARASNKTTKK
ncbi:MAG: tetratricopeptide repeat protein [Flavobacteriia bacterium]|jgi:tetratricopeptide (TPR) repeat protein